MYIQTLPQSKMPCQSNRSKFKMGNLGIKLYRVFVRLELHINIVFTKLQTLVGSLASEFLGWIWNTHVGIPM